MSIKGVTIPLTAVLNDKGIKQAKKEFGSLEASAGQLGKKLAAAFSVAAVGDFLKSSVDAFKQEQVVIAQLSNSLANMGLSFNDVQPALQRTVDSFTNLGFHNEETMLSFNKLAVGLQNPKKALDLMSTAADLARYNQISLADASDLMVKASQGSAKGFKNLGISLDKSLTPIEAFNKLMAEAKDRINGTADAYGNTLAGSMDRASAKLDDAKQKLGEKLAPAVIALSNAMTKYLIPAIEWIGKNIGILSGFAAALGAVALGMKAVGLASKIMAGELLINPIFAVISAIALLALALNNMKDVTPNQLTFGTSTASNTTSTDKHPFDPNAPHTILGEGKSTPQSVIDKETKKWEDAHKAVIKTKQSEDAKYQAALDKMMKNQAALDKKNAAAAIVDKNKQLALDKASAVLKQSQKIFDMNAIELAAAAQGKLTDGDRKRVELKQLEIELQDAIDNKDDALATKLAAQVEAGRAGILGLTSSLSEVKTPDSPLKTLLDDLESGKKTLDDMVASFNILNGAHASVAMTPSQINSGIPNYVYDNLISGYSPTYAGSGYTNAPVAPPEPPNVYVNVDWNQLATNVSSWLQDANAMGTQSATVSRNNNPVINP